MKVDESYHNIPWGGRGGVSLKYAEQEEYFRLTKAYYYAHVSDEIRQSTTLFIPLRNNLFWGG